MDWSLGSVQSSTLSWFYTKVKKVYLIIIQELGSMQRERIKHILYDSKSAIAHTIHQLHNRGYAETGAWSRPQPTETPGEFMSILLRTLLLS